MELNRDQKDALVRVVGSIEKIVKYTPVLISSESSGFEKGVATENLYSRP